MSSRCVPACFWCATKKKVVHNNSYSIFFGKTILLVDDSSISNSIVRMMLEHNGAKILTAENGDEAFLTFCENPEFSINAILMDLAMPVMDGIEACKKIRNSNRADSKVIPIIAFTANDDGGYRKKCDEVGMTDFLTKPLEPNKLLHHLSLYLE